MTPTRLREIAARVVQVCIETRKLRSGVTVPCEECIRAAQDLHELAEEMGPQRKPMARARFPVDSIDLPPAIAALPDQHGVEAEGRTNV